MTIRNLFFRLATYFLAWNSYFPYGVSIFVFLELKFMHLPNLNFTVAFLFVSPDFYSILQSHLVTFSLSFVKKNNKWFIILFFSGWGSLSRDSIQSLIYFFNSQFVSFRNHFQFYLQDLYVDFEQNAFDIPWIGIAKSQNKSFSLHDLTADQFLISIRRFSLSTCKVFA